MLRANRQPAGAATTDICQLGAHHHGPMKNGCCHCNDPFSLHGNSSASVVWDNGGCSIESFV